jgi:hypothetical protein
MKFVGGETAGLSRIYEYFWKKVGQRLYLYLFFFFKSKCYVRINVSYAGSRDGTFNPLFGYLTHSRDCMRRIY